MALKDELGHLVYRVRLMDGEADEQDVERALEQMTLCFGNYPSIDLFEKIAKHYKAKRQQIVQTDIPCVLAEYGIQRATTDDGIEVSLETVYETKQRDKAVLAAWLESIGASDIIKDTFAFEKGEADLELLEFLGAHGYAFSRDSNVNGMSLKKVIRDHIEAGDGRPPADAVELSVFDQAKIKYPKTGF